MMHIVEFALTYNGYQRLCAEDLPRLLGPVLKSLSRTGQPPGWAGVDLLRGTLFFIQRQTHHWGEIPPTQEQHMRTLVAAIARHQGGTPLVADPSV